MINQDQPNKTVAAVGRRTADSELFLCVLSERVDSSMEPIRHKSRPPEPGNITHVPEYTAATVGQSLIS